MTVSVLFVCLHGSAKSVIASAHLQRLATLRGVDLECSSAGIEPDTSLPPHVIAGLSSDGIDVCDVRPRAATSGDVESASYVVAFGCELSALGSPRDLRIWDDVPAVSDGYGPARDEIVRRVDALLEEITSTGGELARARRTS